MCGIVGYVGPRQATPLLIEGLRRLEYRGYDSSGVAVLNGVGLVVRGWSAVLRRMQTGSVRAYAMSFFVGVVAIVGYYLWR